MTNYLDPSIQKYCKFILKNTSDSTECRTFGFSDVKYFRVVNTDYYISNNMIIQKVYMAFFTSKITTDNKIKIPLAESFKREFNTLDYRLVSIFKDLYKDYHK